MSSRGDPDQWVFVIGNPSVISHFYAYFTRPTSVLDLAFQMRVRGFCVLENVIPVGRCEEIRQNAIETVLREHASYDIGRAAAEMGIGYVPSVINHNQSFSEYLADDLLLALVGRLRGDNARISFTSAIINHPDNERNGWHADWPFNQNKAVHIRIPYPEAMMHVTTLWMLSSFSADNGGTLVVPGSHRCPNNSTGDDGPDPNETFSDEVNVSGSAGSVLVMDSRL